jgi:hypothetical protein
MNHKNAASNFDFINVDDNEVDLDDWDQPEASAEKDVKPSH